MEDLPEVESIKETFYIKIGIVGMSEEAVASTEIELPLNGSFEDGFIRGQEAASERLAPEMVERMLELAPKIVQYLQEKYNL